MSDINTYWIADEQFPNEWVQFQPQTVFALARMSVVFYVKTDREAVSDFLVIAAHRYKKA